MQKFVRNLHTKKISTFFRGPDGGTPRKFVLICWFQNQDLGKSQCVFGPRI